MSRAVVAAMTAYTLELREAEVKLNQNESPFDLPRAMKEEVLARVAERPWNVYPDFESMGLRSALANTYGMGAENVLVGNGSNELLAAAIGAFVGPGTPVIFPKPTFALYEKLVTIAGGRPLPIALDPAAGLLPLDAMLEAVAEYENAVVIVCSPNNPTGGVLPEGGLQRLLDSGATVLFDRAYGDFANDALPELHERLVTFSTFSKAWGLAALRVGWLASTAANCREIRKVKLPYSLNVISETIAEAALANRKLRDRAVGFTIAERSRVFAAMQAIDGVTPFPTRANFVAFRVANAKQVFDALHAAGILIRDITAAVPDALRVSIGTTEQNDRFLEALRHAIR
ncbi:MAG TPA: aminotransferase class I/II-fold pyridoxal phosphate-dependent enzyme [Thermoanaerobaculia bacterium]|nr:aminotransferase class I/II-fold pyridoxal phosphate-dependent enzyme [Thermoanaerobaculia bacterium]